MAQGVFKESKTYPVIIGLSTAPGAIMPDGQPTFRGMAIKIIGVEGAKFLSEESDAVTQDFLLVNHPVIPTGAIETYLEQQLKLEKMAGLPEQLQEVQAKLTTAAHKALNVIGIHILFYGSSALRRFCGEDKLRSAFRKHKVIGKSGN